MIFLKKNVPNNQQQQNPQTQTKESKQASTNQPTKLLQVQQVEK